MSSGRLHVTSEIYAETDFNCSKLTDEKYVSKFGFHYPSETDATSKRSTATQDSDGDLVVTRRKRAVIEIEHHNSTDLTLVGLQVWRGALLLADYIFHNRHLFSGKQVVELGSGVGLTGVAAGIYAKRVICTDIDIGGILNIIQSNIDRNRNLINKNVDVLELNFMNLNWSEKLTDFLRGTDIILAADVIYDDDLTDGLVRTIDQLLTSSPSNSLPKTIYIALEKRYVFTVADLESLAPCYEYFLAEIEKLRYTRNWKFESIPIDFPQYFEYERVKELVLLKLSTNSLDTHNVCNM